MTDLALDKVSAIAGVQATPDMLHSTLGRHAARAIRAAMLSELADKHWQLLVEQHRQGRLHGSQRAEFSSSEVEGVGTHEAPRGTLSHWVVIKDGRSRTTRPWFPPPGTRARATTTELPDLTKRRCCTTPSPIPSGRWKSCARCTRSIPAWHALATPSIRKESTLPK